MTLIWNDNYSVNDPILDEEHKSLFAEVNKLHQAIRNAQAEVIVPQVLDVLIDYVQTHFSDEEAYMKKVGYPDLEAHKASHEKLRAATLEKNLRMKKNEISFHEMVELYLFLTEWIDAHILYEDKLYVRWVNELKIE